MKVKGIKYVGPILDNSGYAKACRGNILALHSIGVPVTLSPISFEKIRPDLGEEGEVLKDLINKDIDYNVVIIHTTPEFWYKYKEAGKTNVGYTIWETTKLHPDWKGYINDNVDKVLVGCEWNIGVFKNSGVEVPIGVVPHGIDMGSFDDIKPYNISGISKDTFVFYDVFQWTERKNPLALIKGYWHAFQDDEAVALVLKTYRSSYEDEEKDAIRKTIQRLKNVSPYYKYPKIYLVSDMLSEDEMLGLHARGDCYASLDRGEGFGLSPFTAAACGNPIIITGFGGALEYAKEDNSYLVDYVEVPVWGMPWSGSPMISITCVDGVKRIKDITADDYVFNGKGNIKKVLKVGNRQLNDGEKMHSIKHVSMPTNIEVTNTHKLFVYSEGKVVLKEAGNITTDDYLVVPKNVLHNEDIVIDMCDYMLDTKWTEVGNRLVYCRDIGRLDGVYRKIHSSKELFYLVGLYLAEGCVYSDSDSVSFSFNSNEISTLAENCKECLKTVFGVTKFYERYYTDRNGYELVVNNALLGRFFKQEFNTGSHFKSIPYKWKLNYNKDYRESLLKGYWDGDGHISYRRKNCKNPECVCTTASKYLCLDIRDTLVSLGIIPSITRNTREDGRISYITSISSKIFDDIFGIDANRNSGKKYKFNIDQNTFAVKVTSNTVIKDYKDSVYSMSVENDVDEEVGNGSYILNGIASSNSPWYRGDQTWAEPGVKDAADIMKHVYNNQEEAKEKGSRLKKHIAENFSWEIIGKKLVSEIEKL